MGLNRLKELEMTSIQSCQLQKKNNLSQINPNTCIQKSSLVNTHLQKSKNKAFDSNKGWLSHFTNKDSKIRSHFWSIDNDCITLFLTESESLFYKKIVSSNILSIKEGNTSRYKFKIVQENLTIFVTNDGSEDMNMGQVRNFLNLLKEVHLSATKSEKCIAPKDMQKRTGKKKLFDKLQFALELGDKTFEAKKTLRELITSNGGQISYILTNNTDYLVVCEEKITQSRQSYKIRKANLCGVPVVRENFLIDCVEKNQLVHFTDYVFGPATGENFSKGKISAVNKVVKKHPVQKFDISKITKYKVDSGDCPTFVDDFQVPKYSILTKRMEKDGKWSEIYCVEAQVGFETTLQRAFRVMVSCKGERGGFSSHVYPVGDSFELMQCYEVLVKQLMVDGLNRINGIPDIEFCDVVSQPLGLLLNEMKISSGIIHPEVARLVETVWLDSIGEVMLTFGIEPSNISAEQVRNAIIALMKIENAIKKNNFRKEVSDQFYKFIPQRDGKKDPIDDIGKVAKKRELCQLMKDITLANETTWFSKDHNDRLSQYTALKCALMWLDPTKTEYKLVKDLLPCNDNVKVENIFRVNCSAESSQFKFDVGNIKLLFHASKPHNFVGILSRGLMLPLTLTSEYGVSRSDDGRLGTGIYFSDSFDLSSRFTSTGQCRGSRLMLVNEVALGKIFETTEAMTDLKRAPTGYDSVKGIGITKIDDMTLDQNMNEYVVYNTDQQRMRYIVEFTMGDDFMVTYDRDPITLPFPADRKIEKTEKGENFDPTMQVVEYGLIMESKDASAELEEVHVRAKIIDLVSEVTLFQSYINNSKTTVEAKYVFPLTENAAVCGFEAFINEKHIVGEVKEKKQAHKEYKKAVSEGHGAYLMDEEKPNVFTVSVGNIPPGARVIIKIIYVAELETVNELESNVLFTLPGSLAQWEEKSTLLSSSVTQEVTQSVSVLKKKKSSLMISIDMPFDILYINSPTHKIAMKKTATKACVKLQKTTFLDGNTFQLLIKVAEIHVPRIWIEKEDSESKDQVAMVTFFPEFEFDEIVDYDCTILLDMSNSMQGAATSHSKHLCCSLIEDLPDQCCFNVIAFGSSFEEKFIGFESVTAASKSKALDFVSSCSPHLGGSDVFHILNSILLLSGDLKQNKLHNIFLFSDGHLTEVDRLLKLCCEISKSSHSQTRIFTFAVGDSPDLHTLQTMSVLTGGSNERFLPSAKNTWRTQLKNQLLNSRQPALTDVRIDWCNYESGIDVSRGDHGIFQVPEKVKCVFSGSRLVAYSYIPNCVKATLFANINGKEFSTVVTATELSKITGITLHRLAAKTVFKEHESGRLADDVYCDQLLREERKNMIISLSVKYSVVSKYTSFVAVEKRKPGEDLSITCGPSVSDLLDESFTDIIPEIMWKAEEKTIEENIDELLKRSSQMQVSSILQARNLALEAKSLNDTLVETDLLRNLRVSAMFCKLNLNSESEAQNDLKKILLKDEKMNFDAIRIINNSKDVNLKQDLCDLFQISFTEHSTIKLRSIPESFQTLAIGAYTELFNFFKTPQFSFDDVSDFWNKFQNICCDHENTAADVFHATKLLVTSLMDRFKSSLLISKKKSRLPLVFGSLLKHDSLDGEKMVPAPIRRLKVFASSFRRPQPISLQRRPTEIEQFTEQSHICYGESLSSSNDWLSQDIAELEPAQSSPTYQPTSPSHTDMFGVQGFHYPPLPHFSLEDEEENLSGKYLQQPQQHLIVPSLMNETIRDGKDFRFAFGAISTPLSTVSHQSRSSNRLSSRFSAKPDSFTHQSQKAIRKLGSNIAFAGASSASVPPPPPPGSSSLFVAESLPVSYPSPVLKGGFGFKSAADSFTLAPPPPPPLPPKLAFDDKPISGPPVPPVQRGGFGFASTAANYTAGPTPSPPPPPPPPPLRAFKDKPSLESSFDKRIPRSSYPAFVLRQQLYESMRSKSQLRSATQQNNMPLATREENSGHTYLSAPKCASFLVPLPISPMQSPGPLHELGAFSCFNGREMSGEVLKGAVDIVEGRSLEDSSHLEASLCCTTSDSESTSDDSTSDGSWSSEDTPHSVQSSFYEMTELYESYNADDFGDENERISISSVSSTIGNEDIKTILTAIINQYQFSVEDIIEGFWVGLNDGEFWKYADIESGKKGDFSVIEIKMLTLFQEIVISSGARSLGVQGFTIVLDMLLTAVVLEILRCIDDGNNDRVQKFMIKPAEKWLKYTDSLQPFLYKRLELGTSWEMAAKSVIINLSKKLLKSEPQ